MATNPPPPPPAGRRPKRQAQQITEWPATSDELAVLQEEFAQFRQGLVGSKDFPGGKLKEIQDSIAAAESHRAEDVLTLHRRLTAQDALIAQMPDVIVAKINGTYVKAADFIPKVDARIKEKRGEGRLALMTNSGRGLWTVITLIAAGVITYVVTNVIPHTTTVVK